MQQATISIKLKQQYIVTLSTHIENSISLSCAKICVLLSDIKNPGQSLGDRITILRNKQLLWQGVITTITQKQQQNALQYVEILARCSLELLALQNLQHSYSGTACKVLQKLLQPIAHNWQDVIWLLNPLQNETNIHSKGDDLSNWNLICRNSNIQYINMCHSNAWTLIVYDDSDHAADILNSKLGVRQLQANTKDALCHESYIILSIKQYYASHQLKLLTYCQNLSPGQKLRLANNKNYFIKKIITRSNKHYTHDCPPENIVFLNINSSFKTRKTEACFKLAYLSAENDYSICWQPQPDANSLKTQTTSFYNSHDGTITAAWPKFTETISLMTHNTCPFLIGCMHNLQAAAPLKKNDYLAWQKPNKFCWRISKDKQSFAMRFGGNTNYWVMQHDWQHNYCCQHTANQIIQSNRMHVNTQELTMKAEQFLQHYSHKFNIWKVTSANFNQQHMQYNAENYVATIAAATWNCITYDSQAQNINYAPKQWRLNAESICFQATCMDMKPSSSLKLQTGKASLCIDATGIKLIGQRIDILVGNCQLAIP